MLSSLLNKVLLFYLVMSAGFSGTLYGQPLLFENYSSEQGLSQNSCYSIAQDNEGFMWFGTQDGLNRYDGKQFRIFLPQNDIGKELPSNYISALFFDQQKNLLWVGTLLGTCLYNPQQDSLTALSAFFPFASRLENTPVKKIISFKANEYWFITYNHGLILLNTATRTLHSFFDDENNKHRVSSLAEHNGNLIAGLLEDLFYLLPDGRNYKAEPFLPGYPFSEIKELFSYRGSLWIGTLTSGCFYIDEQPRNKAFGHSFKINIGGRGSFISQATRKL